MIKLKKILLESTKESHCWLSPNGRIIPVNDTHNVTATKILHFLYPNEQFNDPVLELWKKSFLRVTFMYDNSLIVNNEIHPPNNKQIEVLKDIAIKGGHSQIEFDDGVSKPKILWSEFDVL